MNKLRENTGVILWILVIAFGFIWVLQDSGAFDVVGNMNATNIIVVDGDPVTNEEYSRALDQRMQAYQAQTGQPMAPQMVDMTRDQVFNELVDDKLREHEMDRLGITVTDDEIYQMVMGPNPHPIIRQYFGDEQGNVNKTLLQNVIDNPEQRTQWLQVEEFLRMTRRREKMESLITATVHISDAAVIDEYNRNGRYVDVRYVALPYASIPDAQIKLSDADYREFYDKHKSEFERKKTYTVNYVALSKRATRADTLAITEELRRLLPRFQAAANDSLFVMQNASETPYTSEWQTPDMMDQNIARIVYDAPAPGKVVGPVSVGSAVMVAKITNVRPTTKKVVRARHILIRATEGNAAEVETARTQINQARARIAGGESFETVARQMSQDPGSAAQGGDLGYFGEGRMVPAFEQAAFGAAPGALVGPIQTSYGFHLIQVTDKVANELQLAMMTLSVEPNVAELTKMEESLDDLQYYASENGNFKAEAGRRKMKVQEIKIEEDQEFIPGIGNSRAFMNFLKDGKKGEISKVIELNDMLVLAQLENIEAAGVRPLDEMKQSLEPRVRTEKKKGILVQRMQEALNKGGFAGLSAAVNSPVRTATAINYNSPLVSGLGNDIKFTGTALGLKQGATSKVVAGQTAVFVIQSVAVRNPAAMTPKIMTETRDQLTTMRKNMMVQQWLAELRKKAEIEDNRSRFQQ